MNTSRHGVLTLLVTALLLGCTGCGDDKPVKPEVFYYKIPYFSSPRTDSTYLYFTYNDCIYRKPLDGGVTELCITNARFPAISDDGTKLAYAVPYTSLEVYDIAARLNRQLDQNDVVGISWMADSLVYRCFGTGIWLTDLKATTKRHLIPKGWSPAVSGSDFVFMRYKSNLDRDTSWLMFYASGEEAPLGIFRGDYRYPSVSPDGSSVVLSAVDSFTIVVWKDGAQTTVAERAIDASYARDGRIVFVHLSSIPEENGQIWICDPDGENQKPIVTLSDVQ